MKSRHLKLVETIEMRPVRARGLKQGREANAAYRIREHLTEAEMDKLLSDAKTQSAWSARSADRLVDLPPRPARK